jgi:hypothetical protein
MVAHCSSIRPLDQAARGICTQPIWRRCHTNAAEVEAVGIPARLQSEIGVSEPIGMQPACLEQLLKTMVIEMNKSATK